MKSTPTISLQYSGIQSSPESLQINKSVSAKKYISLCCNSKWKILRFLDVTPQENGLLTLPDKSTFISQTFVKNYMQTSSLIVIIIYFIVGLGQWIQSYLLLLKMKGYSSP